MDDLIDGRTAGAMTPDQRDFGPPGDPRAAQQRRPDHTRLNIWLTFAGTILAALIAGVFALLTAGGGGSGDAGTEHPAATRRTDPADPATTRTPADSGDGADGATPATTGDVGAPRETGAVDGGVPVRWSGSVVASTGGLSDAVDLDARPPRSLDDTAIDGDLSIRRIGSGEVNLSDAALGRPAFIAPWAGRGTPGFAQCQEAAFAQGVDEVADIELGAVLCMRTNKDRIARLTVRKISARQGTVTFDSVVWDNS
ncbi:hypothetical protein [Nucisporomicrobium flavum]|uniref:hypothetical protein n=1 Tax=Nucisporomicrobium flavum TaxID=2785915 RepID=UPI0018F78A63|nr:hypothetical protein [Nucisporomicrobium flavum]